MPEDAHSVMSFTSSIHSLNEAATSRARLQEIGGKNECVDSLVSMLGCTDMDKMSTMFLAMSSTATNCDLMRQNRVVPDLVSILHDQDQRREAQSRQIRARVGRALHNIVHAHPDNKQCKREAKVLRLLEILRMYADFMRDLKSAEITGSEAAERLRGRGCCDVRLQVASSDGQPDRLLCGKYIRL